MKMRRRAGFVTKMRWKRDGFSRCCRGRGRVCLEVAEGEGWVKMKVRRGGIVCREEGETDGLLVMNAEGE